MQSQVLPPSVTILGVEFEPPIPIIIPCPEDTVLFHCRCCRLFLLWRRCRNANSQVQVVKSACSVLHELRRHFLMVDNRTSYQPRKERHKEATIEKVILFRLPLPCDDQIGDLLKRKKRRSLTVEQ